MILTWLLPSTIQLITFYDKNSLKNKNKKNCFQNNGKLFGICPREISFGKSETHEICKTKSSFQKHPKQLGIYPHEKILGKFSYAKYLKLKSCIQKKTKTIWNIPLRNSLEKK